MWLQEQKEYAVDNTKTENSLQNTENFFFLVWLSLSFSKLSKQWSNRWLKLEKKIKKASQENLSKNEKVLLSWSFLEQITLEHDQ